MYKLQISEGQIKIDNRFNVTTHVANFSYDIARGWFVSKRVFFSCLKWGLITERVVQFLGG
jgi:hypothetical protein